jgi:hypothetical protein
MNFLGVGPFELALAAILSVPFWHERIQTAVWQVVRAISRMMRQ